MNICIWYFSGTGNTWHISHEIGKELEQTGASVHIEPIETLTAGEITKMIGSVDVLGLGYPVYGSDLPLIMKEFLQALPTPKQRLPVFLFCTQWLFSGDGTWAAVEFLPDGYEVQWSEHFGMPNNICVSIVRLPYTNDQKKISKKAAGNTRKITRLAENISTGNRKKRGFTHVSTLLGSMQRSPFRKLFSRLRNDIGIDESACIKCDLCVEICPASNFTSDHTGMIIPKGKCIICVRCYNFCPTHAVTYMGRSHIRSRGIPYRGPSGYTPPKRSK